MKNKKLLLLILAITLLFSFGYSSNYNINISQKSKYEHMVLSTLYAQIAAENKALQYQAYNIAKEKVNDYCKLNGLKDNEAIIVDVDETVLETSIFQIKMIMQNLSFAKGWNDYINSASCKPINGALDFLKYIDSLGIKIFYVSNRNYSQMDALIRNLNYYGFPQVNKDNIYLKKEISDKEPRRKRISSKHKIILLIGDSLEDFSDIFRAATNEERIKKVNENRNLFGDRFIILPNASYGTWESLIYHNNWKLSLAQQDSLRKLTLENILDQYEKSLLTQ